MKENITWPRAILWSLGTGLLVAAMFAGVLLGWKWTHPADPFLASLDAGDLVGLLGILWLTTSGIMMYWFTFMLAERREAGRGRPPRQPRV
jgi:xanthosine utilization system XapX-like protein